MSAMTEVAEPPTIDPDDAVRAGRAALGRHDWQLAFERFTTADAAGPLTGRDLEDLAQAAFFVARADVELEVKERAYKAYEAAGDMERTAYLALDVAREYGFAGKHAIANVWMRRAERILGNDGETYAHGYLALLRSEAAAARGETDDALRLAQQAIDIGEHAADPDLKAFALSNLGELKIAAGETTDGIALLEEASMSAVNGELSPFTTGVTACRMISACRDLTDYRRASEWIEATERYCHRQALTGFPGVCQIHRAEVTAVGGAWDRAEADLQRATIELEGYHATPPQADGFYAIGDIRRLRGDIEGAESALREAHARGRSPQPALALIRLGQGKIKAAISAIDAALAEETRNRWARARLLPAKIEIAVSAGDSAGARTALEELTDIVATYESPALDATLRVGRGRVHLAEGDAETAVAELRSAIRAWRDVGAPYEIARARMVLSEALRAVADDEDADLEVSAALEDFRRLGAILDVAAAERISREVEERRSGPSTARMTFMFTDIVGSTNLAEALGDQAWDRLLRWHDETLRAVVARHAGEVVKSTGDGFFVAFESASSAVDAAAAIHRALRDHRETTGFAIAVRIGLHTSDANRRGADYSGKGVHVAARVAALAGAGEILATSDTLQEAGDPPTTPRRTTEVRGVTTPVELAAVIWD